MLTGSWKSVATRSTRNPGCRTAHGTGGAVAGEEKSTCAAGSPPVESVNAPPLSEIHQAAVWPASSETGGRNTSRSWPLPSVNDIREAGSESGLVSGLENDAQWPVNGKRDRVDRERVLPPIHSRTVPPASLQPKSRRGLPGGKRDVVARLVPPPRRRDRGDVRQNQDLDRRCLGRSKEPLGPVGPLAAVRIALEPHAEPVVFAGVELMPTGQKTDELSVGQVNVDLLGCDGARRRPDDRVRKNRADLPIAADVVLAGSADEGPRLHVDVERTDDLAVGRRLGDQGRRREGQGSRRSTARRRP